MTADTGEGSLRFLVHNVIAHPIAGLLWYLGLESVAEAVHSIFAPAPAHQETSQHDHRG